MCHGKENSVIQLKLVFFIINLNRQSSRISSAASCDTEINSGSAFREFQKIIVDE